MVAVVISVVDGMLEGGWVRLLECWNADFHLHTSLSAQRCNCLSSEGKHRKRGGD